VTLESGESVVAYVPSTGRLPGALWPGGRVWLAHTDYPKRKTAYTLLLTELPHGGLCSINAVLANQLFAEAMDKGGLAAFPYEQIEHEVKYGHSRLDFRLTSPQAVCWVEVKSVTFVENGAGLFPDAPTERGQRHLEVLAELAAQSAQASAVFIAQREDARYFSPCENIDPEFSDALRRVQHAGVAVHAYRCAVTLESIEIAEEIPVNL
jgi:sugar fermentation stimulation protein A